MLKLYKLGILSLCISLLSIPTYATEVDITADNEVIPFSEEVTATEVYDTFMVYFDPNLPEDVSYSKFPSQPIPVSEFTAFPDDIPEAEGRTFCKWLMEFTSPEHKYTFSCENADPHWYSAYYGFNPGELPLLPQKVSGQSYQSYKLPDTQNYIIHALWIDNVTGKPFVTVRYEGEETTYDYSNVVDYDDQMEVTIQNDTKDEWNINMLCFSMREQWKTGYETRKYESPIENGETIVTNPCPKYIICY